LIRVLQVAESGTGGVPAFITRVCDGLTGEFAFGIACPSDSELVEKQPGEAEIYEIGMSHGINPISDIRAANRIRSVVKTDGYDVVHLNSTKAGIIGVPLKRRLSAKTVFTPHALRSHAYGDGSPRKRIALFIEKRICDAADLVVACSTAEAEEVVRLGLAQPEKVRVVENGIDLEPLSSPSKLLRAEFGIPADAFVVGTAGRISPQKDPATFVRAAELVCREVPDAHFVMVGSGPLEESAREQISAAGLGDRVHLLGWRDDAIEVLKLFDLFLMTSLYEGGSFAILEAAGARKPIVACDSPGVRELIEDGQTGLLVPQGDAFAIARAVLRLHKDAKMGQRLAAEAFEKIAWPRRLEVMVDAWGALYRSLLDERAPAQVPQSAQEKPA
jgi:glycosyltransferase involved in cell wall biosynthesis